MHLKADTLLDGTQKISYRCNNSLTTHRLSRRFPSGSFFSGMGGAGGGEFRRTPESETATPPGLTSLPFRPSDTLDEKGLFSLAPRLCRGVGRRALCHQSGLVSSTEQCSPAERARRGSQPDSDHSANSFRGNLKACFFFVHSDFRGRAKRRLIVVCCYETYRDGQREEEENSWESFLVFPFFY